MKNFIKIDINIIIIRNNHRISQKKSLENLTFFPFFSTLPSFFDIFWLPSLFKFCREVDSIFFSASKKLSWIWSCCIFWSMAFSQQSLLSDLSLWTLLVEAGRFMMGACLEEGLGGMKRPSSCYLIWFVWLSGRGLSTVSSMILQYV